jgi:CubicO group peptidase (beta-lactamase class C family)
MVAGELGLVIEGFVAPGFEAVREEFERNFLVRGDIGAAVAVAHRGEFVVDLWGGWADEARTRRWTQDTIVNIWSAGKPMTALAVLRLVDRGLIELDAPVATYWPAFAEGGKGGLPVRYLLTHQAGLPAVRKMLPPGLNLTDWEGMCAALAEQEPWWEPDGFGYHTNTSGFCSASWCDAWTGGQSAVSSGGDREPLGAEFTSASGPSSMTVSPTDPISRSRARSPNARG